MADDGTSNEKNFDAESKVLATENLGAPSNESEELANSLPDYWVSEEQDFESQVLGYLYEEKQDRKSLRDENRKNGEKFACCAFIWLPLFTLLDVFLFGNVKFNGLALNFFTFSDVAIAGIIFLQILFIFILSKYHKVTWLDGLFDKAPSLSVNM